MLIITVFCHFDSVTLSKDICTLRDILRDQLVLKTEKIRDTTSQAFTMSLIKRTECTMAIWQFIIFQCWLKEDDGIKQEKCLL